MQCAERPESNEPEEAFVPALLTQTPDTPLDAAVSRMPRRPYLAEPLRLIAEYDDDLEGASALAEAVRTATRRWGIGWIEGRAGSLAHTQAGWLLANDHPASTHLRVHAEYSSDVCTFTIMVGDPGGLLPALEAGDQWRLSLGPVLSADAFHRGGRDRRLRCVLKVRAPWRVRITWDTARLEGIHPEHSIEDCGSADDAIRAVSIALGHEAVRTAHWQGPEDRDDVWRELGKMAGDLGGDGR